MAVTVGKSHLKYSHYTWTRDKGDGEYTGILDRMKIDKDEGYEVLYFIQTFMNKFKLTTLQDVHAIEDILHSQSLKSVVMRDELIKEVKTKLGITA